jgi:D-beta-D-heptose 7-phosphate kinase/D-beta-D-heptose 1-phosphate adenosyltransferase
MHLSPQRARDLFLRFPHCRILVVGDLMLDRYVHGTVERISPEAPVPILKVLRERTVPGGSCNVALNVQALGGQASLCGLAGTCSHGDELIEHLRNAGVDVSSVLRDPAITTIVKTRIMADRQQMLRVDRERSDVETFVESEAFRAKLQGGLEGVHGVILEDYGKGVLRPSVVSLALAHCRRLAIPSGYDPKDNHELDMRGITFATPNRKEAFHMAGVRDRNPALDPLDDADLLHAAARLRDLWQPEHLMITLGPQGMLLITDPDHPVHVSTRAREVFDVSGAGDTVIATTMLALAAGASFREAAELANAAAGIVVAKLGTATTSPDELLAALEEDA